MQTHAHNIMFMNVTLTPPDGAIPTTEWVRWGREQKQVFRMPIRPNGPYWHEITELVPKTQDGKTLWHYRGDQRTKPITVRQLKPEWQGVENPYFEFILVDRGNGCAVMERGFRPSLDDEERMERERMKEPEFLMARLAASDAERAAQMAEMEARLRAENEALAAEMRALKENAARVVAEIGGLDEADAAKLVSPAQVDPFTDPEPLPPPPEFNPGRQRRR